MPHVPLDKGYLQYAPIFNSGYTITAQQCGNFADYCKTVLYAKSGSFNHAFSHGEAALAAQEMEEYLNKEDRFTYHVHMNAHKTLHEMMRTWMHIHFPYQTQIVEHYLMKHNKVGVYSHVTSTRAQEEISQNFLRNCIRDERENNSNISNTWDVKLSDLLVSHHAKTYYAALDHWLTSLRDDVVLIQWCADWFDELQFYKDKHGPLHAMLEPSGGSHARLPTYRLMHSHQVVRLADRDYFTKTMSENLSILRNEDLANLIKCQWYALTPCLARLSHGKTYRGLVHDGILVPKDFATRKAQWMQQLENIFSFFSDNWQANNKDCAYDVMKVENTSDYLIDNSISLQKMSSELALERVNIGNPIGVLLCPTFTTSAPPMNRKGKLSNQMRQRSKQQKNGRDYKSAKRGNESVNHGANDSDSFARERAFLEELARSRYEAAREAAEDDDDHERRWGNHNSENGADDRGGGERSKPLNMGLGPRSKKGNVKKGLVAPTYQKFVAEKNKEPKKNTFGANKGKYGGDDDDKSGGGVRKWEGWGPADRHDGGGNGGRGGGDSLPRPGGGGGGGDSLPRPGGGGGGGDSLPRPGGGGGGGDSPVESWADECDSDEDGLPRRGRGGGGGDSRVESRADEMDSDEDSDEEIMDSDAEMRFGEREAQEARDNIMNGSAHRHEAPHTPVRMKSISEETAEAAETPRRARHVIEEEMKEANDLFVRGRGGGGGGGGGSGRGGGKRRK